jgi:riboflavin kinase/FMN adenylyltransferase
MAVYHHIEGLPGFKNAVITIGTFDGVHMGHRVILHQVVSHAKEVNGESILLTFEPHPRKIIFPDQPLKLLTTLEEKIQLITETGIQHIVVVPFNKEFASLSAQQYIEDFLVKNFRPNSIVIGYDHHFGSDRKGDIDLLKENESKHNYKVYEIPAQLIEDAAVSSTKIRNAIAAGEVGEAAKMLNRPYTIKGIVSKGAQLGRTIDYPTANVVPTDADKLVPGNGVYAILAKRNNETYKGMLNIGIRPTVSNDTQLHIETHLFDFNSDIYGEILELELIARLRDEQKFSSLDALKDQLHNDKIAAQEALA